MDNRGSPEGERVIEDGLKEDARRLERELVAWRRRLHRRPELAFEERETARFVAERLRAEGFEVHEGLAGTGVVGILRALHGPSPRPAVLLRADMDGLPIQEVSGREYGSELPGRMHACGHDGHVAMLLGAARLLAARRSELRQDVVVCFQPGEEGAGGARKMIETGVLGLASVRWAFAIHLWSLYPEGTIHARSGPLLAAQDEFTARLKGPGGHGGMPHLAADPVVAACQAVVALQAVVSRSVDPLEAAVLTVGSVEAGSAPNVIPAVAELRGTLRSFREEVRALLVRRLREVLEGAAQAGGCGLELELRPGYPAVVNDPRAVEKVRRAARETVGEGRLFESPPLAVSEDFAYFLERVPGALVLLGAGDPARGIDAPHHSPRFDISESALKVGAELFARLALDLD